MVPPAYTVFDGAQLRAVCHGAGDAGLLVTFDNWRRFRKGFGAVVPSRTADRMGFRNLIVTTAANDWFLNGETAALRVALARFVQPFAVVRAVGYSMGGYGALTLSAALGLTSVVLFGPQVSIRRKVVPFETRWWREQGKIDAVQDCLGDVVKRDLRGVILFDPRSVRAETLQARAVQALVPGLQMVALPFSGHPPTAMLRAGQANRDLLARGLLGVVTAADVRAVHRAHREATPDYVAGVLRFMKARGAVETDMLRDLL
jgi:hypothetical protein